jgi:TPR repeat protein
MPTIRLVLPVCAIGLAILGSYSYRQQQISAGAAAYDNADYAAAFRHLSPFGGWRDPGAEARLAYMYLTGSGVTEDDNKAFTLAQEAGNGGSAIGDYFLGHMYYTGSGTPVNFTKAAYWQQQGAASGLSAAQTELGNMYQSGRGVPQDYSQAAAWYQKAADP